MQFFVSYHGGRKYPSPAEEKAGQARWMTWMQNLGTAMVSPGTPLGPGKAVTDKGVADDNPAERLTGYSVLEAKDIAAAIAMVKDCPFLEIGTVKVAQVYSMAG